MAQLRKIWIENNLNSTSALRIDWDNDRHQRIEIRGSAPKDLLIAFEFAIRIIQSELRNDEI